MFPRNQKTQLGSTFLEEPATAEPGPSLQGTSGSHSKGHSPAESRQDFLPVPCWAAAPGPGSSTGVEVDGRRHEKRKSATWRSSAHVGAVSLFAPTKLPTSGQVRKEKREGKGLVCVCVGEDGTRLCQVALPGRGNLPFKGGQMWMSKESCGSSGKALEVSFAADMTVQNH